MGAYASTRLLPANRAIRLPDDISTKAAAASVLRGITAHMLLTRTYPVKPGTTILIHAAAGGLGFLMIRWAKYLGATVIGTVSSDMKSIKAKAHVADHLILGRNANLVEEVAELTNGSGVDVAYDGIGGDMLMKSIACVRLFGTVASIGQATGPIQPIDVEALGPLKSLSLARPSVMAYAVDMTSYVTAAASLFDVMRMGVTATIGAEYPLTDVARAPGDLESGQSDGSLLLIP